MSEPTLHCWKGRGEWMHEHGLCEWYEVSEHRGTCMLPRGHEGDHEWTDEAEIGVTFVGAGEGAG